MRGSSLKDANLLGLLVVVVYGWEYILIIKEKFIISFNKV